MLVMFEIFLCRSGMDFLERHLLSSKSRCGRVSTMNNWFGPGMWMWMHCRYFPIQRKRCRGSVTPIFSTFN